MEPRTYDRRRAPTLAIIGGIGGASVYVIVTAFAIVESDGNAWKAVVTLPILTAATFVIARAYASKDGDPTILTIIMAGWGIKVAGALARYWFVFVYSKGDADASGFNRAGASLVPLVRSFDFGALSQHPQVPGTGAMRVLTGIVYGVAGTSRLSGFFIFSWLCFLGIVLIWRGFKIGVPDANARRYLIVLFVLPSLVFWPSSIGKEAWMLFGLGMCAYGTACLFQRRYAGALVLVPGSLAITLVRPHITLLVYCGLVFAALVRKVRSTSASAPGLRIVGLVALLGVGLVVVAQSSSFLGVESLTQEGIEQTLTSTQEQTQKGGSTFEPVTVTSPLDVPLATVTVLFRPFPFEASNVQALIAAAEGVVLIVLVWRGRRGLAGVPRRMRQQPYVAFCFAFTVVFILAFSSFSNFGLLARERTQLLPFFVALLMLPSLRNASSPAVGEAATTA